MGEAAIYHIIIIAAGVYGIFRGWRCGFFGQTGGLLGMLFGIVFCRLFVKDGVVVAEEVCPSIADLFASDFIYTSLTALVIYTTVYFGFRLMSLVLNRVLSGLNPGPVNSLGGAALCLLKYVLFISLIYNVILAIFPGSALMKECRAGDGNMIELVMALAPALMDTYSPCDLALKYQLKEAESISYNISGNGCVISMAESCDIRRTII